MIYGLLFNLPSFATWSPFVETRPFLDYSTAKQLLSLILRGLFGTEKQHAVCLLIRGTGANRIHAHHVRLRKRNNDADIWYLWSYSTHLTTNNLFIFELIYSPFKIRFCSVGWFTPLRKQVSPNILSEEHRCTSRQCYGPCRERLWLCSLVPLSQLILHWVLSPSLYFRIVQLFTHFLFSDLLRFNIRKCTYLSLSSFFLWSWLFDRDE